MDPEESGSDNGFESKPRAIPDDLPKSLDDRRHAGGEFTMPETEMYDGWQGACRGESDILLYSPPPYSHLVA